MNVLCFCWWSYFCMHRVCPKEMNAYPSICYLNYNPISFWCYSRSFHFCNFCLSMKYLFIRPDACGTVFRAVLGSYLTREARGKRTLHTWTIPEPYHLSIPQPYHLSIPEPYHLFIPEPYHLCIPEPYHLSISEPYHLSILELML